MKKMIAPLLLVGTVLPTKAQAYDWVTVTKALIVEGSHIPTMLPFRIDGNAGNCAVGTMLHWNAHGVDDATKAQICRPFLRY
jgi:hypothetical protein